MNSLVDALYLTKYNPFKYGEFLSSFYSELIGVDENILLSQLVIPLCSHHLFNGKIERARLGGIGGSTIWTIFSDKAMLYDMQERLDNFRGLTDQSLQYCLVNDWLNIDPKSLNVSFNKSTNKKFINQKCASNLGRIFSNLSVTEIYAMLGVKPR
ncbi:three component ABC system middle component [Cellvibrio sp. UBA7671]|uniref:three component ABC system middle component n=1 Tax=Cellvibrio sp. UBA7671 TaxID=1946312 RepID=UPI002F353BD5